MKQTIPLLLTALSGLVLLVSTFIPVMQNAGEEVAIWFDILAAIAFVLGGGNLLKQHLQQISDQQPGWGYSAITLITFVGMLVLGLIKFGCPPEFGMEAFGRSEIPFPLGGLPEFRVPGTIPQSRDGPPLPKSVRLQTRLDGGDIVFRGWMSSGQKEDLIAFQDVQSWRCDIERLYDLAQPPQGLRGKISYSPDRRTLGFAGYMTANNKALLLQTLPTAPETSSQVDRLFQLATKATSRAVVDIPTGFIVPDAQKDVVSLTGNELTVHGPMSVGLRDEIVGPWSNVPLSRPLTAEAREQLLTEITQSRPLTEKQTTAFNNFFDADWKAEQLVAVANIAGTTSPSPKMACELLTELQAGVAEPTLTSPAPPPQILNSQQEAAIAAYVNSTSMTAVELDGNLTSAGPFSDAQREAVLSFLAAQPTVAEQKRALCFRLLQVGSLTTEQIDFLLDPIREQFRWRQSVGQLFVAAHQIKYPWSGNYSAQGSPFWWLYEYCYQPLLTTTFAVLAFYVASAAFRAFRAKNLEATLLLGTAFLILLGRTSAGPALTNWLPESLSFLKMDNIMAFIMSVFNTAGNRAIMIGIALGTVSTSLRVLLGIDRSYLGSGKG